MIKTLINKLLHIDKPVLKLWYGHWNILKFHMLGISLGSNSKIYGKVYIHVGNNSQISIGSHFAIRSGRNFNPLCSNSICSIEVSDNAQLKIGDYSGISGGSLWITDCLTIGNHVNIGANCMIMDGDIHSTDWKARQMEHISSGECNFKHKPITIGDDVWIGGNCIILKGVTIGARSIIGAGSVVTKDIPSDCIAAGNPCKVIRANANIENY